MECTFDPGVETLIGCTRCGRPACPSCLVDAPVGMQCPACVEGLAPDAPLDAQDLARLRRTSGRRAAAAAPPRRRPGWVFYTLLAVFAASIAIPMLTQPDPTTTVARLEALVIVVVGAVVSVTLHEWGHAFVAYRGGDRSVEARGYLTLDFRKYAHPLLSIGLPILFLFMGGLPLPGGAVWIDHRALRTRWWDSAVSLAGPTMSFLSGLVPLIAVRAGVFDRSTVAASALAFLGWMMIVVTILNLLPVPGLDGYGVIEPHLPAGVRQALQPLRQWGMLLIVILVLNSAALGFMFDWALGVTDLLGIPRWLIGVGYDLANPRLTR